MDELIPSLHALLGVCLNNGSLTLVSWVIPIPTPSLVSP